MPRFHRIKSAETGETVEVAFTEEEEAAADAAEAAAVFPPLTRRQVRKAMVLAGISVSAVNNAIAAIQDDTERELAEIDWQDAPVYLRSHPLFDALAPAVGVTSEQIDAMWLNAAANIDP